MPLQLHKPCTSRVFLCLALTCFFFLPREAIFRDLLPDYSIISGVQHHTETQEDDAGERVVFRTCVDIVELLAQGEGLIASSRTW